MTPLTTSEPIMPGHVFASDGSGMGLQTAKEFLSNRIHRLCRDRVFVSQIVRQAGTELQHVAPKLQNDQEIVDLAVKHDRRAIRYIGEQLETLPKYQTILNEFKRSNPEWFNPQGKLMRS